MYIEYIQYINFDDGGDQVNIYISHSADQPIYEQIVTSIKRQILKGELSCGDPLPSMRLLAKELRISVITTKRAYEELERDGFITTAVGKGSFVSEVDREALKEEQLKKVEEYLEKAIAGSRQSGITLEELTGLLEVMYKEG